MATLAGPLLALYWLCNPAALAAVGCTPPVRQARPVPVADAGEFTIATQNLMRFFDDVDDGDGKPVASAEYRRREAKLARQVQEVLRLPDVLAVQEVENEKVLTAFAATLARQHRGRHYRAIAPEGFDYSGIDVGFLVRADWQVLGMEPLFRRHRLKKSALFDRPPLWLRLRTPQGGELELVNVHLRSLKGSDDPATAPRVAHKRRRQAEVLAGWVARLAAEPRIRLLLLGDFNATPDGAGGVDVLGRLQAAGLHSLLEQLPPGERYTYVYRCQGEALDHLLASAALLPAVQRLAVSRGNAGVPARLGAASRSPLRSADHDGLVLYLGR